MQYITVVEPVQTKSKRLLHGKMFQEEFSIAMENSSWNIFPFGAFAMRQTCYWGKLFLEQFAFLF